MRYWLGLCALVLVVPSAASAQPRPSASRDDGIRMLLTGDYQGAAQVLRTLAEDPLKPDAAAQFLLAILYDTGQGVPRNVMRACGLYRQAADADGPFRETGAQLRRMLNEDSPVPDQMCAPGPWHDTPPALIELGPNHSVRLTSDSIVVRYQGEERRVGTGTLPGAITLPVIYTPLDVTSPVRERRHFLQSFIWVPDNASNPSSWTLGWILNEVVAAGFFPTTGERNVLTVTAAQPPAAVDLSRLARVHVNANGEAEWIIAGGPDPRSGTIPKREPR